MKMRDRMSNPNKQFNIPLRIISQAVLDLDDTSAIAFRAIA